MIFFTCISVPVTQEGQPLIYELPVGRSVIRDSPWYALSFLP